MEKMVRGGGSAAPQAPPREGSEGTAAPLPHDAFVGMLVDGCAAARHVDLMIGSDGDMVWDAVRPFLLRGERDVVMGLCGGQAAMEARPLPLNVVRAAAMLRVRVRVRGAMFAYLWLHDGPLDELLAAAPEALLICQPAPADRGLRLFSTAMRVARTYAAEFAAAPATTVLPQLEPPARAAVRAWTFGWRRTAGSAITDTVRLLTIDTQLALAMGDLLDCCVMLGAETRGVDRVTRLCAQVWSMDQRHPRYAVFRFVGRGDAAPSEPSRRGAAGTSEQEGARAADVAAAQPADAPSASVAAAQLAGGPGASGSSAIRGPAGAGLGGGAASYDEWATVAVAITRVALMRVLQLDRHRRFLGQPGDRAWDWAWAE